MWWVEHTHMGEYNIQMTTSTSPTVGMVRGPQGPLDDLTIPLHKDASHENSLVKLLTVEPYLCRERLTLSNTGVEYWEYGRGFLCGRSPAPRTRTQGSPRRTDHLSETRNQIRRLVNCNVAQYGYEATFLTFTYKKNQGEVSQGWRDWHMFMRKLRSRFGAVKALTVLEFQERGAVHFHCIFFNLPPEVEKEERHTRGIAELWGHGFVDIERIRSASNAGAYVCKYLNASATDPRLRGKKFYSCTRGLLRPIELRGDIAKNRIERILDEDSSLTLVASSSYEQGGQTVRYYSWDREVPQKT